MCVGARDGQGPIRPGCARAACRTVCALGCTRAPWGGSGGMSTVEGKRQVKHSSAVCGGRHLLKAACAAPREHDPAGERDDNSVKTRTRKERVRGHGSGWVEARADVDASAVETRHGHFEPLALCADAVGHRHLGVRMEKYIDCRHPRHIGRPNRPRSPP